jgi:hypothetical protein
MLTTITFEAGDRVKVKALNKYAVCYQNKHGGTEGFPPSTELTCEVVKTWHDYETGQRYIGRTDDGQEIYFGQFQVEVELID